MTSQKSGHLKTDVVHFSAVKFHLRLTFLGRTKPPFVLCEGTEMTLNFHAFLAASRPSGAAGTCWDLFRKKSPNQWKI